MTKGDRDKLRAELAGKAMIGWLGNSEMLEAAHDHDATMPQFMDILADVSVNAADAVMKRLGLSLDKGD